MQHAKLLTSDKTSIFAAAVVGIANGKASFNNCKSTNEKVSFAHAKLLHQLAEVNTNH